MAFYTIHPREIDSVLMQKNAQIIDVRSREEYRRSHFRNAVNCPYDDMEYWLHRFPKRRVLMLYCEYGSTSLLAARRLAKEGYEVYTVVGGIHAIRKYMSAGKEGIDIEK